MYTGDRNLSNLDSVLSMSFTCSHMANKHLAKAVISTSPQSKAFYKSDTLD